MNSSLNNHQEHFLTSPNTHDTLNSPTSTNEKLSLVEKFKCSSNDSGNDHNKTFDDHFLKENHNAKNLKHGDKFVAGFTNSSNKDAQQDLDKHVHNNHIPPGTRVFKKSSPNNKITAYLGKRDFVDHLTHTDPVDGVILIDPEYITGNCKVWASILAAFRYGREDLDVLGLTFRKDLYLAVAQVYPPVADYNKNLTRLQERLLKKLGPDAYPFFFEIPSLAPASVILQPAPNDTGKPCGVDYELKCFVSPSLEEKPLKKSTVRLAIRKVIYAPDNKFYTGIQPHTEVSKDFMMSPGPLHMEICLDKKKYYHGEPLAVNVQITNNSNKTVKKIKIAVRQYADICLFSTAQYKCNVAELESDDGFPLGPCCNLSKVYYLTPLLSENRDKRGLALDGKLKHEDTNLASSTIFKDERAFNTHNDQNSNENNGNNNRAKEKENLGIIVNYAVKVKLIVSFGQDVSAEVGFVLTHPKPVEETEPADSLLTDGNEISSNKPIRTNEQNQVSKLIEEPDLIELGEEEKRLDQKSLVHDDIIFEDFSRLRLQNDILNDLNAKEKEVQNKDPNNE
ncbi:unnamed protein product [Gordionus sp. m RMFG-2023]